jgi:hypothetical protein
MEWLTKHMKLPIDKRARDLSFGCEGNGCGLNEKRLLFGYTLWSRGRGVCEPGHWAVHKQRNAITSVPFGTRWAMPRIANHGVPTCLNHPHSLHKADATSTTQIIRRKTTGVKLFESSYHLSTLFQLQGLHDYAIGS